MELKIKGLRLEKYITTGEYSDGNYEDAETIEEDRYVLYCIGDYNYKYEVTLWNSYSECYSGWCGASYGNIDIKEVEEFANITHTPIKELSFEIDVDNKDIYELNNDIFSYSDDGGDNYYPCGNVIFNIELFKETNRIKSKRPVWIFKGESNIGKSYLGYKINKDEFMTVYETDSNENLPNIITQDVIVLGNKYKFTIEDINSKVFGDHELIIVDFNKYSE